MKSFTINSNDDGQRLDKFLSKAVYRLPKGVMCKFVRTKKIKVNHKRCEISTRLHEGDLVELYINDSFFERNKINLDFLQSSKKLDIIYEDDNILIINKEVGVVCHNDSDKTSDTLVNRVKKYLYEKKEYIPENENSFSPALCNRLDRNTCGIVIAAKNACTLREINEKIKDREIHKKYLCITMGVPQKKFDTATAYLCKDEIQNKSDISLTPKEGYKKIITRYNTIKTNNNLSLVEIELITGRTHQIRAYMAYIGCPLLGDTKYGLKSDNDRFGIFQQTLSAYSIEFDFKEKDCSISYLNKKIFKVPEVWFQKKFFREIVI